MYHLQVSYKDGVTNKSRSFSLSKSVANFYDEDGYLCMDKLEPEIKKIHASLTSEKKEK